MRLIEEKSLIKAEIIILIGVVFISIIYETAQAEIDDYNYKIIQKQNTKATLANQKLDYNEEIAAVKFDALYKVSTIKRLGSRTDYADDELYNIRRGYYNGSIDNNKLLELEHAYLHKMSDEATRQYNIANQDLKSFLEHKPICFSIFECENLVVKMRILQISSILIGLVMYLFILKSISARTNHV